MNEPLWKTRDGKRIAASDMTDEHILNAWRIIARYQVSLTDPRWDWGFAPGARRNREYMVKVWTPIFDREFKRRGLTPKPLAEYESAEARKFREFMRTNFEEPPKRSRIERFVRWIRGWFR